jgi:predicted GNAT family acetyltransferase
MPEIEVSDNTEAQRYEAYVDGELAGFTEYRMDGDVVVMPHTVVESEHEGQGVAGALAKHALDDIRARDLKVVPSCAFIRGWIDRHPDYADLVAGS